MNIVINEKFRSFSDEIASVPNYDGKPVQLIRDQRNRIVRLNLNGLDCVVKRFKVPHILNRVVYAWFRRSKARRAYENAMHLKEIEIETNQPIAYIETFSNKLFNVGYFIYEWLPYPVLDDIDNHCEEERREILKEFAQFMYNIHNKGVFFLDINSGNVMYHKVDGKWNFALLDINRMAFKGRPISRSECLKVFKHSTLSPANLAYFLEQYATLSHWNIDILIGKAFLKRGVNLPVRIRKLFKRIFLKRNVTTI